MRYYRILWDARYCWLIIYIVIVIVMSSTHTNVLSDTKVKEYTNLSYRLDKIKEWILIDFDLVPPQKLQVNDYPDRYFFDPFGLGNMENKTNALIDNSILSIQHSLLMIQGMSSDNISKIFVVLDDFKNDPDAYISLTEFLAETDWVAVLKKISSKEWFIHHIRKQFDRKYRKQLKNKSSHLFLSKQTYHTTEDFSRLVEYLAKNNINVSFNEDFVSISEEREKDSHV